MVGVVRSVGGYGSLIRIRMRYFTSQRQSEKSCNISRPMIRVCDLFSHYTCLLTAWL